MKSWTFFFGIVLISINLISLCIAAIGASVHKLVQLFACSVDTHRQQATGTTLPFFILIGFKLHGLVFPGGV